MQMCSPCLHPEVTGQGRTYNVVGHFRLQSRFKRAEIRFRSRVISFELQAPFEICQISATAHFLEGGGGVSPHLGLAFITYTNFRSACQISAKSVCSVIILQVNSDGLISFGASIRSLHTPRLLPLSNPSTPFIAPYWADVDTTRNNGRIYYRNVTGKYDSGSVPIAYRADQ